MIKVKDANKEAWQRVLTFANLELEMVDSDEYGHNSESEKNKFRKAFSKIKEVALKKVEQNS